MCHTHPSTHQQLLPVRSDSNAYPIPHSQGQFGLGSWLPVLTPPSALAPVWGKGPPLSVGCRPHCEEALQLERKDAVPAGDNHPHRPCSAGPPSPRSPAKKTFPPATAPPTPPAPVNRFTRPGRDGTKHRRHPQPSPTPASPLSDTPPTPPPPAAHRDPNTCLSGLFPSRPAGTCPPAAGKAPPVRRGGLTAASPSSSPRAGADPGRGGHRRPPASPLCRRRRPRAAATATSIPGASRPPDSLTPPPPVQGPPPPVPGRPLRQLRKGRYAPSGHHGDGWGGGERESERVSTGGGGAPWRACGGGAGQAGPRLPAEGSVPAAGPAALAPPHLGSTRAQPECRRRVPPPFLHHHPLPPPAWRQGHSPPERDPVPSSPPAPSLGFHPRPVAAGAPLMPLRALKRLLFPHSNTVRCSQDSPSTAFRREDGHTWLSQRPFPEKSPPARHGSLSSWSLSLCYSLPGQLPATHSLGTPLSIPTMESNALTVTGLEI